MHVPVGAGVGSRAAANVVNRDDLLPVPPQGAAATNKQELSQRWTSALVGRVAVLDLCNALLAEVEVRLLHA